GSSSGTISWTTNEASDSQVEYGTSTAYGSLTPLNSSMVTSHSEALSGLLAGTLYHYRVKSKDASGNQAVSADFTVLTLDTPTPPTVPTGLSATAASLSRLNLASIGSTDNVGVTGYTIYRGGNQIGTSASTTYSDTGLLAATTYSYAVAAFDAAGNTSAQSVS